MESAKSKVESAKSQDLIVVVDFFQRYIYLYIHACMCNQYIP